MQTELNYFDILNLNAFSARYRLFEIVGLRSVEDEDYDTNSQYIIESLSYFLKHPVTVIMREGKPHLVIRDEAEVMNRLPAEYPCKRDVVVYFKDVNQSLDLDFVHYDSETKKIILRFLQFDAQAELYKDGRIWQPGSGDAYFNRTPADVHGDVAIYTGFILRVMERPNGDGFGLVVDITKKYVSAKPLPFRMTRREFQKLKAEKCHLVYEYGNKRYEIKPEQFSDLNVTQSKFKRASNGQVVSLLQDIKEKFGRSMPPLVAQLPDDASVLIYQTNDGQERMAPAGLCYRVYDTEDPAVQKLHRKSIVDPYPRRRLIRTAFKKYLNHLKFGDIPMQIDTQPMFIQKRKFTAPDFLFGNDRILSVRNTRGAIQTNMNGLGRKRLQLLEDSRVGFYTNAAFETQHFIVPQTLFNMYGNEHYFLRHLGSEVDNMHPSETGWKPIVIAYDDRDKKTSTDIGFSILQKMEESVQKGCGGYALVMLPSNIIKNKRRHDETAALVVSELLSEYDMTAAIMHSHTVERCFAYADNNGQPDYFIPNYNERFYGSYLRGVAINQVLLNNERWPYVLHTPLHADLTIGIDVKNNVAGFTFVDKQSKNILTRFNKSKNRERLSTPQMKAVLMTGIAHQAKDVAPIKRIVIHRDGRLFSTEQLGIEQAVQTLKDRGVLPADVSVNLVEIPKHSVVPLRVFDVVREYDVFDNNRDNESLALNPEAGTWLAINEREAFLCTTGREYRRPGTSKPLYVKFPSGNMPLEEILEDIYFLSCLAYTKPDDCSRYPLTIKITDRRINILGAEFDLEALDVLKAENF